MRQGWLDFAKGVGITLVIAYHTLEGLINSISEEYDLINRLAFYLSMWIVPVFFVVSGILVKCSIYSSDSYRIKKKILNFSYIYVVWCIIVYCIRLSLSNITNTQVYAGDILKIIWDPLPTIWFIYALLLSFVLVYFLRNVNKVVVLVLALFANLINSSYSGWFPESIFERFGWIFLFYYFGFAFSDFFLSDNFKNKFTVAGSCAFFVLSSTVILTNYEFSGIVLPVTSLLLTVFFLKFSIFIVEKSIFQCFSKYFLYIGSISLFVYLVHFPIPSAVRLLFSYIGWFDIFTIVFSAVFISHLAGLFSYRLSQKTFIGLFFNCPRLLEEKILGRVKSWKDIL